jgi:hypothetical protein
LISFQIIWRKAFNCRRFILKVENHNINKQIKLRKAQTEDELENTAATFFKRAAEDTYYQSSQIHQKRSKLIHKTM